MLPTSSLLKRRMANYDLYRITDPSINGSKKTEMSLPLFPKPLTGSANAHCSQSLTSNEDITTSISKKKMNEKQPS